MIILGFKCQSGRSSDMFSVVKIKGGIWPLQGHCINKLSSCLALSGLIILGYCIGGLPLLDRLLLGTPSQFSVNEVNPVTGVFGCFQFQYGYLHTSKTYVPPKPKSIRAWSETTLNYGMMVERYQYLKEEIGGPIPSCEISSLLWRRICEVVNCLLCFSTGLLAFCLIILFKKQ